MKKKHERRKVVVSVLVLALSLIVCQAGVSEAAPMGTAFTYQGHLYDANHVANGLYDFQFKLFDDPNVIIGNQVGGDVNIPGVDVIDAQFTVVMDFGSVFDGNALWLEIGVRPGNQSDPNIYTILSPRQEVTPAPYAFYAQSAEDANTVDGYHAGNASGQVAVSNTTLCTNLNADLLDGYHAGSFTQISQDYGRSGVSATLYEGTTALSSKYLGISATAANSDMVDGYHAGNSSGQVSVSNATLCTNLNADMLDGQHGSYYQNASNLNAGTISEARLPQEAIDSSEIENGTVTSGDLLDGTALSEILDDDGSGSGLDADLLDGYHAGSFVQAATDYGRSGVSATLYEGTTALASKYLGISATATNSYGLVLPFSGSASSGFYGLSVTHTLTSSDAPALLGTHDVTDYYGVGVKGVGGYKAIVAECTPTGSNGYYGIESTCIGGSGYNTGVYSSAEGSGRNYGVYASAINTGTDPAYGVYGYAGGDGSGTKYAFYGSTSGSGTRYAGYFAGNVTVSGTLSKGGGSFKIDHPLDPANKFLQHSFVESPDMMNVYNGNVELGENGTAVVELPEWFGALNRDFRYQLTCIGGFAPVYIAKEITNNSFTIGGGTPGVKVSWQVTGIRQDPFANENRIQVEMDKSSEERGRYLHPKAYGLGENMSIDQHTRPEREVKVKEAEL